MSVTSRLRSLWRNLLHRNRVERELEDELRGMFDLLVEEKRRAGLRAEDAHRAAALELGGVAAIKDEIRDARTGAFVDTFLRDIRYAWRGMRRDPRFTIVVVFSLAIGIGSTTAVFTVFNVTLLQPLSSPEAHRLVLLSPERRGEGFVIFNPVYESLRDEQRTLSGMSAVSDSPYLKLRFEGEALPTYARGSLVSGSYFSVLGVAPFIGRTMVPQDDEPIGTAGVSECAAVVSHDLWTRRLGAAPGKMIALVLQEAMILTAIGLVIGLPLAIGAGNALRAFLFGVPPGDAVTLAASCIVLTIVALFAACVPARRASRIDPGAALREA